MHLDVYELPRGASIYIVDVQSDFLSQLATRMVIPIVLKSTFEVLIARLHPAFEIRGQECVLVTHQLTSILRRELRKPVASLSAHHDEITRALDILFTGF